jgi:class 3 adenylate cyclase
MDAKSSAGVPLSSPAAAQRCAKGAGLDSGAAAAAQSAMPSIALPATVPTADHLSPTPLPSMAPQLQSRISTSLTDVTGIHCGPTIVGEMGYGNVETLTKNFACELVVSDETVSRAGVDLSGSALHEIEIRGKREMLAVRIVERAAELPAPGTAPIRQIELVNA